MVIFHSYVKLPEGMFPCFSYDLPMKTAQFDLERRPPFRLHEFLTHEN